MTLMWIGEVSRASLSEVRFLNIHSEKFARCRRNVEAGCCIFHDHSMEGQMRKLILGLTALTIAFAAPVSAKTVIIKHGDHHHHHHHERTVIMKHHH